MTTTFDAATVPQHPEFGLYGKPWGKLLAPNVRHPAKFSLNLVRWIFQHGLDSGYWRKGDTILDPFCGVSMGGVIAPEFGLRWTGVELEPTFVQMSRDNFAHQFASGNPAWANLRAADMPVVYQGDSRRLRQILATAAGAVSSPPYSEGLGHWAYDPDKNEVEQQKDIYQAKRIVKADYGTGDGQIGRLKMGVLTSPVYGNRVDDHGTDKPGYDIVEKMGDYGPMSAEEGQIGVMRAGGAGHSPAYGESEVSSRTRMVSQRDHGGSEARDHSLDGYGATEGQIGFQGGGNLAGMTSPPYGSVDPAQSSKSIDDRKQWETYRSQGGGMQYEAFAAQQASWAVGYGSSEGQIGGTGKETYWDACTQVYQELYETLQPGSVCAIVVKDFVRAYKRVNLCDMTLELLVSLGYIPLEQTLAMLWDIKPDGSRVERKSFFRRNAEKKGAPPIDWETILWVGRL